MGTAEPKVRIRALLIIIAFIIAYLFYALYQEKFEFWNSRITDRLFSFRTQLKPVSTPHDNLIIHVDANLNAFRSQHAQIIRNLSSMDIATLVFDTIFSERVGDEEDIPLIIATSEAGNLFLGMEFESFNQKFSAGQDTLTRKQKEYLASTKWDVNIEGNAERFPTAQNPIMTYPALASASSGLGYLNIIPDPDGILRRVPLMVRYGDMFYPSIAFRAVCHYLGVTPEKIMIHPGKSVVLKDVKRPQTNGVQDLVIPIDARGNMILNFTRSWEKIQHYSYSEILQAHAATERLNQFKEELSGKIVVISETVEAPIKIRPILANNNLSSGVIHSIVIQNILKGSFFRELSRTGMVFIELALLIIAFFISARFSAPTLSLGAIVLGGLYIIIAAYAFINFNLIFQFIRPLLILFCALLFILIASGVERAVLLTETERARKLAERELEIGREIQAGFFPNVLPTPHGWELVTYFKAARHVAGDFYDAFSIGEKKDLGFVVADVCDKGVGAALFMALFRSLIRVLSGSTRSTNHLSNNGSHYNSGKILQHTLQTVNNYISITHEDAAMFSTIFFGILDTESGVLQFINGGHEPPIVIGPLGVKASLRPTGPAVGLYPDAAFEVRSVQLEPEDVLLAYTDGVIDAQNKNGETFSRHRLNKLLAEPCPSAKALIDAISLQIKTHISNQDQFDDITILALRRKKS